MSGTLAIHRKLFIFFFVLVSYSGIGQQLERYNWYFGNSTQAIRFNRTSRLPSIATKAIPFGGGGSATASDPANANLLFYTDGQRVYDACHIQMPQGTGLLGNITGNQPTAICPVPGQNKKYFVFANSSNFPTGGAITVSVVDMNLFGMAVFPAPPQGDLESKNNPVAGLAPNRAEGMMIVPHANGTDFWLITQQVNSTNFSATLINAASYTGTFTHVQTTATSIPTTAANFSYHEGKRKIAVSAQDTNTDAIILDFNPTAGTLVFDRYILNSGLPTTGNQSIYDIEWSITGDFLYLSRHGETGSPGIPAALLQYDYLNPTTTLTNILPAPVFRSYGVQMAPDSMIYHLYQTSSSGPILLGRISKPDTIASQVNYRTAQLTTTSLASTQFSSFSPKAQVNLLVNFTYIGTCQRNNTTFFPDIQPGADSVRWNFGDMSAGSNDWSPVHKYAQAQTFSPTLTAYYQGQSQTATVPITITPFAIQLNLVQDTTACSCELPFPKKPTPSCNRPFRVTVKVQGGTPTSYTWSNGDTGPTLTPDSVGYYYVVVTDASGCSAYAGVNVKEYGVQDSRRNKWYFGNKAGINFNPTPPIPLSESAMNAPEGCTIISDRNGQQIFYTDGDKVYNKNHVEIASGIGGDPLASQSSLIVAVPGDETLYYIFTNEAINGTSMNTVKYSLFDLKQNNGLGAVVKQNLTLFSRSTERITANGRWIIIHEYGNNTFRAYPFSATGIGDPVLTAIGSDHACKAPSDGEGYMQLGPRNQLAVALSMPGTENLIELFNLNDTTGKITNYRKIDLKQATGQVYGIEFSPGGNKLFATIKGPPSQVVEYFIDSVGRPFFKQRIQNPSELGAIELGPDGQIYMAINGSNVLGTIQAVDDTTRLSSVNFSGFNLAGGTNSRLGLPNFVQQQSNAFGGPDFTFTGVCLGDSTKFVGTPTDAIDSFTWFFGDGSSPNPMNNPTPAHLYALAGTYNVTMGLTNRCGLDTTIVKPVTINAKPARPTIPGAAALCNGPVTLDANTGNLPGLTFRWSGGQTTKSIVVTDQSIVRVTITDTNGCTSNGQSLVADNRPQVNLGPDQTVCQNSFTLSLDAQNPGTNYVWTVNGGGTTTAQTKPVDTTTPGAFTYQVVVTDPITTCTTSDQIIYTIKASPLFVLTGTDPTTCLGTNGTLILQLQTTTPATGPYSYFMTGPGGVNKQAVDQNAPQSVTFSNASVPSLLMPAGTYSVVVQDQISQCTISQSFGLSDAPFTANATPILNCDPIAFAVTSTAVALPLIYTVTNGGSGQSVGPTNSPTANFNTTPIAARAGITSAFTIQLRDNAGCILSLNQQVTPNTPVPITITPSVCTTPPTITVAGATTYSWTGPGIVGATNGSTIQISGNGQLTYTVTANSPGACQNIQPTTVILETVTSDFTQSDPCQTSVILTATPSGTFTYRWYKGGVFQPTVLGRTVSLGLSESGASYQTELFSTRSGCAFRSQPKTIQVVGVVDAALSATPACEDNKPFTLTTTTSTVSPTFTWFRNNTALAGFTTQSIDQTDAGTYKVEVTKATCKATAQITVVKAPLPVGNLPNRSIICNDPENNDPTTNQVDLDPGNFTGFRWFKNELPLNYSQRVYTATSQGKYRVEITNSFGCVA
ncbi:MAG: PKD domain-containing protein, partial [Cyclobacteriaceae bacterium]|nr:PKD domain-containing protein [Cyclobacteriaceae bacterium]